MNDQSKETAVTRERIVEAARSLFFKQGCAATGVAQILKEADAKSGSLYHFFPSIDDLLVAVLEKYQEILEPQVLKPAFSRTSDPIKRLFAVLEGYRLLLEATQFELVVARADIDLRPGGLWRTSYSEDSNLNDDASIHHTVLAYDPYRMLASRTIKPPKNFPFPNAILKTWSVVYFEPAGDSATKVTALMLGFGDDEESQKMRAFFEAGNKTTLDNLVRKYK